MQKQINIID